MSQFHKQPLILFKILWPTLGNFLVCKFRLSGGLGPSMWVGALHEDLGQMGKKWFLRHNLATTCQNFTNNPLSFKFTLSNCFSIFKTHKQKSITNNSWRLNRIPQKSASDPKKKTWQKLSGYKLTSWLNNKTFLNLFFFALLNSMKIQLCFDTLLKTKNNFLFKNFLKTEKSNFTTYVQTQSTLKWSCWKAHFIVLLKEKPAFNSVCMLSWNCLLKMFSQKNIAFPKPCALEEETDVIFYSILKVIFVFTKISCNSLFLELI